MQQISNSYNGKLVTMIVVCNALIQMSDIAPQTAYAWVVNSIVTWNATFPEKYTGTPQITENIIIILVLLMF